MKEYIRWAWRGLIIVSALLLVYTLPLLMTPTPNPDHFTIAVFACIVLLVGTYVGFKKYPEIVVYESKIEEPVEPNCLQVEFEEFRITRSFSKATGISEVSMNTYLRYTNKDCGERTTIKGFRILKPNGEVDVPFQEVYVAIPVNDSQRKHYNIPIGRDRTSLKGTLVVEHVLGQTELPIDCAWSLKHGKMVLYP